MVSIEIELPAIGKLVQPMLMLLLTLYR